MNEILLVATPGGHVDELFDFEHRLGRPESGRIWVTARTAQTESLLDDRAVEYVPPVASREGVKAMRSLPGAIRLIRRTRPSLVVSTGAALAIPYMIAARLMRVPTHYIESATRLTEPSLTGRMARRIPGIELHHQGRDWTADGWHDAGSVFDRYEATRADPVGRRDLTDLSVIVTLGSEQYPFTRARDDVARALGSAPSVRWQLGHTPAGDGLEGTVSKWVPYAELMAAMAEADVVVCHAGVGSVLSVLRSGRCPVVVPRLGARGEHIDDHQLDLARFLHGRGLAQMVGPDDDVTAAITAASTTTITRRPADRLSTLL